MGFGYVRYLGVSASNLWAICKPKSTTSRFRKLVVTGSNMRLNWNIYWQHQFHRVASSKYHLIHSFSRYRFHWLERENLGVFHTWGTPDPQILRVAALFFRIKTPSHCHSATHLQSRWRWINSSLYFRRISQFFKPLFGVIITIYTLW